MKKVILTLALIVTLAFVSCKNDADASITTTDSTAVATDSIKVDTTGVVIDTLK
tara:strand:- start:3105 stop:3266 length:162 start_codon:yes stop_codon:yes gene_type:complete